jgi:hypothetical protein
MVIKLAVLHYDNIILIVHKGLCVEPKGGTHFCALTWPIHLIIDWNECIAASFNTQFKTVLFSYNYTVYTEMREKHIS